MKKLYQCDMAFSLEIVSNLQQHFTYAVFYHIDISIILSYNESTLRGVVIPYE